MNKTPKPTISETITHISTETFRIRWKHNCCNKINTIDIYNWKNSYFDLNRGTDRNLHNEALRYPEKGSLTAL